MDEPEAKRQAAPGHIELVNKQDVVGEQDVVGLNELQTDDYVFIDAADDHTLTSSSCTACHLRRAADL
jgi:hypothetical protein